MMAPIVDADGTGDSGTAAKGCPAAIKQRPRVWTTARFQRRFRGLERGFTPPGHFDSFRADFSDTIQGFDGLIP